MPKENITRAVAKTWQSKPTVEGAGVHLKRAFGFSEVPQLDPFLLLDAFRTENPAPRHRDDHVSARRRGRAWRQPRQSRHHLSRRRAMDDGGQRYHSSGDAEGRR